MPNCKECGVPLAHLFDPPPEYCDRCNPSLIRVSGSYLDQLENVPVGYRILVAQDQLHEIRLGGDVEFFYSDEIDDYRSDHQVLMDQRHMEPFARTAGGDIWCWTSFRREPGAEPEILLFEDSLGVIVVYAPSFQHFLYRSALEDAWGKWLHEDDSLAELLIQVGQTLQRLDATELGADLISLAAVTPFPAEHHPDRQAVLTMEGLKERLVRYFGPDYVEPSKTYGFHMEKPYSFLEG